MIIQHGVPDGAGDALGELIRPQDHGAEKLLSALRGKGIPCEQAASLEAARGRFLIVAGRAEGGGPATRLLKAGKHPAPQGPEALVIRRTGWKGQPVCLIAGSDDRGLMYAELDVADRVRWGTDPGTPLAEVRDTAERPDVRERALSVYTMNRAYWESRFHDPDYWARYLDLLAQNRFNSLVVIFGYENGGFLAPCYPYFFDVEQFPEVRLVGMTRRQQQRGRAWFGSRPPLFERLIYPPRPYKRKTGQLAANL